MKPLTIKKFTLPLTEEDIKSLKSRDFVYLTGTIYTARDAAHQRLSEMISKNETLPIDLNQAYIYYAGPTPSKDGVHAGSIGPTTSYRMDAYMDVMAKMHIGGTIGKGKRSENVRRKAIENHILYFVAIGGLGAKLSLCVESMKCVAFEDLGPEAIYELKIKDFPVIVGYDIDGNSCYPEDKPLKSIE